MDPSQSLVERQNTWVTCSQYIAIGHLVFLYINLFLDVFPAFIRFYVLPLASACVVKVGLWAYFTFLSCLPPSTFEDQNLSEVNCYSEIPSKRN